MEYFFEKMAARGWMLKDANGGFWGFERQTPRNVKFSVVILKDVSMWEGSVNEKSGDFQFYCERAGWHFACAEKCMQILWSEDRGLVPVETDEALKMEAVKSQFRKQAALLMVLGVLFAGVYFWPALMGAPSLAGYKLGVLLETNGGVLALFCMLYLFLSGLAGVVFYLVWCQAAKRAVSQKKPVRYRSYPLFRLKDIATKTFCFLLAVFFYIGILRGLIQDRDWRGLATLLLFVIIYGSLYLFMWSRRKTGFRWRYLLFALAAIVIMIMGLHKIDTLAGMEEPKEDTWMTGDGPFLEYSLLLPDNDAKDSETGVVQRGLHDSSSSILLEQESYRVSQSGNEFSYTLYKSRYKGVLNYIRELSKSSPNYRESGAYWDGNIYVQGFFYHEPDYWNRKETEESGEEVPEVTYRVSILRNGPYILIVRYKVHERMVSRETVDSRAAVKMRELPGIL